MTDSLRVAIVHYHLRRGGVTSVILRAADALVSTGASCVVISGESPGPGLTLPAPARIVPDAGYRPASARVDPGALADQLQAAAISALGAPPDVWHVHNHALGKNPALTAAVGLLARRGGHMLLQVHDFAEDGRPGNYRELARYSGDITGTGLEGRLYPRPARVHYAVLNERDRLWLTNAGMPEPRVHLLANPIAASRAEPGAPAMAGGEERPLFLYPTRAIRRKNLGEFLLWALIYRDRARFAATLSPGNPAERPGYEQWVAFARDMGIPAEFGVGERPGASFDGLMSEAAAVITVSVAEGFGLAFLEPCLFGIPVVGRDLPDVTAGLKKQGVDLGGLYERLDVPLEWIDERALRVKVEQGLTQLCAGYGLSFRPAMVMRALDAMIRNGRVDFGRLDEDLQRAALRRMLAEPALTRRIEPPELPPPPAGVAAASHNRRIAADVFGVARYAARLETVYRAVLDSKEPLEATTFSERRLLEDIAAPERFCLLRT